MANPADYPRGALPRARKRFGQNFLRDAGVISRIVRAIGPRPGERLVEIGPGQGALTEPLLQAAGALEVIELDRDLIPGLRVQFFAYPDFVIHEGDALKFDFPALAAADGRPLRVVGNLPYNISTPLIFHLLASRGAVADMHFMLQKEVVERLAAEPGGPDWGRLSVMTQYHCQVESLFVVPPEAFVPRPKVDSRSEEHTSGLPTPNCPSWRTTSRVSPRSCARPSASGARHCATISRGWSRPANSRRWGSTPAAGRRH